MPVAGGVTALAVALMAWDHLLGNDKGPGDEFPVDPGTFALTAGLILVTAGVVFGVLVPRALRHPETVHRAATVHSTVAFLLAVPASWLGFPLVVAGGGIALGLQALDGPHRRMALAAVGVGVLVLVFGVLATAFPASNDD